MKISAKVEQIIQDVAALNDDERDELMRALEPDVSVEWRREILRRTQEIDEGKVRLVTEEEFLSHIRAV